MARARRFLSVSLFPRGSRERAASASRSSATVAGRDIAVVAARPSSPAVDISHTLAHLARSAGLHVETANQTVTVRLVHRRWSHALPCCRRRALPMFIDSRLASAVLVRPPLVLTVCPPAGISRDSEIMSTFEIPPEHDFDDQFESLLQGLHSIFSVDGSDDGKMNDVAKVVYAEQRLKEFRARAKERVDQAREDLRGEWVERLHVGQRVSSGCPADRSGHSIPAQPSLATTSKPNSPRNARPPTQQHKLTKPR